MAKKKAKKKAKRKTKKRTMVEQGHVSYMGRPTTYGAEIVDQALDYLVNYDSEFYEHPFPSVVGLAQVINRSRNLLYAWAKLKKKDDEGNETDELKYPEWADIMETLQEVQELKLLHGGITAQFNTHIAALVLGKHGYHKKVDNEMSGPGGGPIETKNKTLTVTGVESQHPDSK